MKRTQLSHLSNFGRRAGNALLLVALLAGPGLATPSAAAEPPSPSVAPTSTATASMPTPSPTPVTTAAGTTTPTGPSTMLPTPAPSPTATAATPTSYPSTGAPDGAAMAAAIGAGGAEMGQRSARVVGTAAAGSGTTSKTLTTEALATQSTWQPTFGVQGLDVSGHQTSVNWQQQWNMGARFAYVKATEGNYYSSETFASQYQGSRSVGMVRGAYHFAIPNWSSGADQARYFVQNGGGWSADGYTLPPVLDIEFNPYAGRTINGFNFGNTCYDMSACPAGILGAGLREHHAVADGTIAHDLHQHIMVEAVHGRCAGVRELPAMGGLLPCQPHRTTPGPYPQAGATTACGSTAAWVTFAPVTRMSGTGTTPA